MKTIIFTLIWLFGHHFTPTTPTVNQQPQLKEYTIETQAKEINQPFEFILPMQEISTNDRWLNYTLTQAPKPSSLLWSKFKDDLYDLPKMEIKLFNIPTNATDTGELKEKNDATTYIGSLEEDKQNNPLIIGALSLLGAFSLYALVDAITRWRLKMGSEESMQLLSINKAIQEVLDYQQRVNQIKRQLSPLYPCREAVCQIATYLAKQQAPLRNRILNRLLQRRKDSFSYLLTLYLANLITSEEQASVHFPISLLEREAPSNWLIALKKQEIVAYEPRIHGNKSFIEPLSEVLDQLQAKVPDNHLLEILDKIITFQKAKTEPKYILDILQNLALDPHRYRLLTTPNLEKPFTVTLKKTKNKPKAFLSTLYTEYHLSNRPEEIYAELFRSNLLKKIIELIPTWTFEQQETLAALLLEKHIQPKKAWDHYLIDEMIPFLKEAAYSEVLRFLFFAQYHKVTPKQLREAFRKSRKKQAPVKDTPVKPLPSQPLQSSHPSLDTLATELSILLLRDTLTEAGGHMGEYITPTLKQILTLYRAPFGRYGLVDKILTPCYPNKSLQHYFDHDPSSLVKKKITSLLYLISQYQPSKSLYLSLLPPILNGLLSPFFPKNLFYCPPSILPEHKLVKQFKKTKPLWGSKKPLAYLFKRIAQVEHEIHEKLIEHTYPTLRKPQLSKDDLMWHMGKKALSKRKEKKDQSKDKQPQHPDNDGELPLEELIRRIEESARKSNVPLFHDGKSLLEKYQNLEAIEKVIRQWGEVRIRRWCLLPHLILPLSQTPNRRNQHCSFSDQEINSFKETIQKFKIEQIEPTTNNANYLPSSVYNALYTWFSPFARWSPDNPNLTDSKGNTPLHYALKTQNYKLAHYLVNIDKLEVNKANWAGFTPLQAACKAGNIRFITLLLNHPRLDLNKAETHGENLLFWACRKGYKSLVDALLHHTSVHPNALNQSGKTVLDITIDRPSRKALIKAGAQTSEELERNSRLAIALRAMHLSAGFPARTVQKLALLCLAYPQPGKGRLLQINTGEGKSWITALFSGYKALAQHKVDITTTSAELSIRETKERDKVAFFQALGLSCSENSDHLEQGFISQVKEFIFGSSNIGEKDYQEKIEKKKKKAYKASVLYGTAFEFEAGILKEEFYGQNEIRNRRGHDTLIVDEVDSMFIDDKGHSTRISSQTPGFNHLQNKLATIWRQLNDLDQRITEYEGELVYFTVPFKKNTEKGTFKFPKGIDPEKYKLPIKDKIEFLQKTLEKRMKTLFRKFTPEEAKAKKIYDELGDQLQCARDPKEREALIEKMKKSTWSTKEYPTADPPPPHLHDYLLHAYPRWIESAILAKYSFEKNKQYAIEEGKIIPIDHLNTGTLQRNVVWQDGLTQFLCIKENLVIEPISLNTNYLSNIAFFKRYKQNLYGFTGTLGTAEMRRFLEKTYGVDTLVIPPFKELIIRNNQHSSLRCKEFPPFVTPNLEEYIHTVILTVAQKIQQGGAVLLLVPYISYASVFKKCLQGLPHKARIKTYTGTEEFTEEDHQLQPGDIIIATNIAGRGTDFKVPFVVNQNGGLHVIMLSLPRNERVYRQNAGRTARKGNPGSFGLILYNKKSAEELFEESRKAQEKINLEAYKQVEQVLFEHKLFQSFCNLLNHYCPSKEEYSARFLRSQWEKVYEIRRQARKASLDKEAVALRKILTGVYEYNTTHTNIQQRIKEEVLKEIKKYLSPALFTKIKKGYITLSLIKEAGEELIQRGQYTRATFIEENCKGLKDKENPSFFNLAIKDFSTEKVYQKPDWSPHIREGIIERWGFFLYSARPQIKKGAQKEVQEAFDQFLEQLIRDIKEDNVVRNPYYYVLAGNESRNSFCALKEESYYNTHQYQKALAYYRKAIDLDPARSLYAYYNLIYLLLEQQKGFIPLLTGKNQNIQTSSKIGKKIIKNLQKARSILTLHYKPELLSFHMLTTAHGKKNTISQQIQRELNLLLLLEQNLQQALAQVTGEAIRTRKSDGKRYFKNIRLTAWETIEEIVKKEKIAHDTRALTLAKSHGFTHCFTIEGYYVGELTKWEICKLSGVITLGVLQTLAAAYISVQFPGSAAFLLPILRKQGINDIWTGIQAGYNGEFDGREWAIQKSVSMTTDLIFAGASQLWTPAPAPDAPQAVGFSEMWEETKNNFSANAKAFFQEECKESVKESIKEAGKKAQLEPLFKKMLMTTFKQAGLDIAKGIAKEGLNAFIDYQIQERLLPYIEAALAHKVEKLLIEELAKDTLIQKALQLDQENRNKRWEEQIIATFQEVYRFGQVMSKEEKEAQNKASKEDSKGVLTKETAKEILGRLISKQNLTGLIERFATDPSVMNALSQKSGFTLKADSTQRIISLVKLGSTTQTAISRLNTICFEQFAVAYQSKIEKAKPIKKQVNRASSEKSSVLAKKGTGLLLPRQQQYPKNHQRRSNRALVKVPHRNSTRDDEDSGNGDSSSDDDDDDESDHGDSSSDDDDEDSGNGDSSSDDDDDEDSDDEGAALHLLPVREDIRGAMVVIAGTMAILFAKDFIKNAYQHLVKPELSKVVNSSVENLTENLTAHVQKEREDFYKEYIKEKSEEDLTHNDEKSTALKNSDREVKEDQAEAIIDGFVTATEKGGEGNEMTLSMLVEQGKRPCYVYDEKGNLLHIRGKKYGGKPIEITCIKTKGKPTQYKPYQETQAFESSSAKNNLFEVWAHMTDGKGGQSLQERGQKVRAALASHLKERKPHLLQHAYNLQFHLPIPPPPPPIKTVAKHKEGSGFWKGVADSYFFISDQWSKFSEEYPYVAQALPYVITAASAVATGGTSALLIAAVSTGLAVAATNIVEHHLSDEFKQAHPGVVKAIPVVATLVSACAGGGVAALVKGGPGLGAAVLQGATQGFVKGVATMGTSAVTTGICNGAGHFINKDYCKQQVTEFFAARTNLSPQELEDLSNKVVHGGEMLARGAVHHVTGKLTGKVVDKGFKKYGKQPKHTRASKQKKSRTKSKRSKPGPSDKKTASKKRGASQKKAANTTDKAPQKAKVCPKGINAAKEVTQKTKLLSPSKKTNPTPKTKSKPAPKQKKSRTKSKHSKPGPSDKKTASKKKGASQKKGN